MSGHRLFVTAVQIVHPELAFESIGQEFLDRDGCDIKVRPGIRRVKYGGIGQLSLRAPAHIRAGNRDGIYRLTEVRIAGVKISVGEIASRNLLAHIKLKRDVVGRGKRRGADVITATRQIQNDRQGLRVTGGGKYSVGIVVAKIRTEIDVAPASRRRLELELVICVCGAGNDNTVGINTIAKGQQIRVRAIPAIEWPRESPTQTIVGVVVTHAVA